jgi:hypothetical protein
LLSGVPVLEAATETLPAPTATTPTPRLANASALRRNLKRTDTTGVEIVSESDLKTFEEDIYDMLDSLPIDDAFVVPVPYGSDMRRIVPLMEDILHELVHIREDLRNR